MTCMFVKEIGQRTLREENKSKAQTEHPVDAHRATPCTPGVWM